MYIAIRLLTKNQDSAEYAFGEDETCVGRLTLNLQTGDSQLLQPHPKDHSEGMFQRAARKLLLHWRAGQIPEQTCWAT